MFAWLKNLFGVRRAPLEQLSREHAERQRRRHETTPRSAWVDVLSDPLFAKQVTHWTRQGSRSEMRPLEEVWPRPLDEFEFDPAIDVQPVKVKLQ